jgi:hypothetical protein
MCKRKRLTEYGCQDSEAGFRAWPLDVSVTDGITETTEAILKGTSSLGQADARLSQIPVSVITRI